MERADLGRFVRRNGGGRMKTYYPQAALEGFAAGLARKLNVQIVCAAGKPRTDGHTVYLPPITQALDEGEFRAMCGIALHEAAHVFFGTVDRMKTYAGRDSLKAVCYNAVADVADETRMELVIQPAGGRLFRASNDQAETDIVANDALNTGDPVWAILAAAILVNRTGGRRLR